MRVLITSLRGWYARFEGPVSSIFLVVGFIFDALTLRRVDFYWENAWIIMYLLIIATCIVFLNLSENNILDEKNPARAHFWLVNVLQFAFGGVLSAFLVFYFRSTTLSVTWPFLFVLFVAFMANERLKKHYARLTLQISFFYLILLSFSVFIVPVFFHRIGIDVFLISGLLSLGILCLFLLGLGFFSRENFKKSKNMLIFSVGAIYVATNILYFFNLIPPIPLSLKDGGVFHSISRNAAGAYILGFEDSGWLSYVSVREKIHVRAGDPVYAFSSIFSPTSFNTAILHEWQYHDANLNEWRTANTVGLSVTGGRDGGYRTYSLKENINPGKWRVNVKTSRGQIIGRLRFDVIATDVPPSLKIEIKD